MKQAEVNDKLRCEISLLSNFQPIQDPLGWEVGKHGIEIEFHGPQGKPDENETYRGTYLPHVAPEQGWDQVAAMESLLQKAGYKGGLQSVKDRFKMIRTYESIKFGMDFNEYKAFKE